MEWLIPYKIDDEPATVRPKHDDATPSPGRLSPGANAAPLALAWFRWMAAKSRCVRRGPWRRDFLPEHCCLKSN